MLTEFEGTNNDENLEQCFLLLVSVCRICIQRSEKVFLFAGYEYKHNMILYHCSYTELHFSNIFLPTLCYFVHVEAMSILT